MNKLASSDRASPIRLAASLPPGSEEKKVLITALSRTPTKAELVKTLKGKVQMFEDLHKEFGEILDNLPEEMDTKGIRPFQKVVWAIGRVGNDLDKVVSSL